MYSSFNAVKAGKRVAIWGMGKNAKNKSSFIKKYIEPIVCVDSNKDLWGKHFENIKCIAPKELVEYQIDIVVITLEDRFIINEISSMLRDTYLIYTLNQIWDDVQILAQNATDFGKESPYIKHFSCEIGSCVCNLNCSYCYVDFMDPKLKYNTHFSHSIPFIVKALSRKRLGGVAFFNMCGEGETLLKPGYMELLQGLLSEGHYVGVITNGTVDSKIEELLEFDEDEKKRLLVQCSCHYLELKRQNKLDIYFANVNRLKNSHISVCMTMPGADEYIPYIAEIKDICIQKTGLLPVISPIRTSTTYSDGFPLGSKLSWDEYCQVWEPFKSKAIEMRAKTLGKFKESCYAGINSGWINIETGEIRTCIPGEYMDNIYNDITKKISFRKECHVCKNGFCSHNNLFLSGRNIGDDMLLTWYQNFVNVDSDGNPTYSDEMRKATDYCCDY